MARWNYVNYFAIGKTCFKVNYNQIFYSDFNFSALTYHYISWINLNNLLNTWQKQQRKENSQARYFFTFSKLSKSLLFQSKLSSLLLSSMLSSYLVHFLSTGSKNREKSFPPLPPTSTFRAFQPKLEKTKKKSTEKKIPYISGKGTF